jgi:hypothetical protein
MNVPVGVLSALALVVVLSVTIAVAALISLRNECARERATYASHCAYAHTQSSDPVAGPEQVGPGGDAGPDHTNHTNHAHQ